MKHIAFLFIVLFSFNSAHASLSDEDCVKVYRDQASDLKEYVDFFNEQKIDHAAFATEVAAISTLVTAQRLACRLVESPEVKNCVTSGKNLYESIRKKIKLSSVLAGNQTKVEYRRDFLLQEKLHDLKCYKYN
jgi:hypothetical protein